MGVIDTFRPKPKHLRPVSVPIGDGEPDVPAFIRRGPAIPESMKRCAMNDMPTAAPQNLDHLQREVEAEQARQNAIARRPQPVQAFHADDKTLPCAPLVGLRALLARLTYNDMKKAASDIAKVCEIPVDAGKLADAMGTYAAQEDAP